MWQEQETRGARAAPTWALVSWVFVSLVLVSSGSGALPNLGDFFQELMGRHGSWVWGHEGQVWLASCKIEFLLCPSLCASRGSMGTVAFSAK